MLSLKKSAASCENKGTDQLHGNRAADQHLCFCYALVEFKKMYMYHSHISMTHFFFFCFQKKSQGHVLLEQVFYHLDVIEKDYFGLQYTDHHNVSVSTVMVIIFRTDRSGQTVQTQIRLLLEDTSDHHQGIHICYSICLVLMKYPKVWHYCLNFRKITAKFSGVRNLRNFTVHILLENS